MPGISLQTGRSTAGRTGAVVATAVAALVVAATPPVVTTASAVDRSTSHKPVVVSLTYDDGTAGQLQASSIMTRHGMRGTFFINSGRLGRRGYMSASAALALQSHGNEIGGHTVSHADLPTLSTDEAKRQVCNDRASLLKAGLKVANFAYPYGDQNSTIEQIVHNCGYNSARDVGGVMAPGVCEDCPYAQQIPPGNAYALRTPDSVKNYSTLQDMENYVLHAEEHGGGWVILVMHRICDDCSTYSVSAGQLDSFLAWLAPRAANGTTVAPVGDVIGGSLQPAVNGPPPRRS
jgi:peptidoglycan/xylan/chitin deacetylase (PgdA/CDA1 family)